MSAIIWHAKKYLAEQSKILSINLDKAAVLLQADIVKHFGSPPKYPIVKLRVKNFGGKGTHIMTEKRWRETHHSKPGDPPFIQLGHLKRSIGWQRDGDIRLVGSSLKPDDVLPDGRPAGNGKHSYAWYLEYGTTKMAARPYLRPAFQRMLPRLKSIMMGK